MKILTKLFDRIYSNLALVMVLVMLIMAIPALAQEEQEEPKPEKPARPAFESAYWFDGQTGVLYNKNTLEFAMQHRFGLVNSGNNDLIGIYGAANIRLGFSYAPIKNLNIGFGYTKNKLILDFNAKYGILTQTRSNSMPVSLAYYVNMGIEQQSKENYINYSDRMSYFHELIIMRRFNKDLSILIAPSFTHYNSVTWQKTPAGEYQIMNNDTWGISAGLRYKFTSQIAAMIGYDQPLTNHDINDPLPSINIGVEFSTGSHAFQILFTNNNKIQPQENFMFNQNDYANGDFLIGFNITRLWSF